MQWIRKKSYFMVAFGLLFLSLVKNEEKPSAQPIWGFYAHKLINRMAVFTLPPDVLILFKKNIEYLTEHAVDPDMRRYASAGEAQRHYIDLDEYGLLEEIPFHLADAELLFDKAYKVRPSGDTVLAFGYPKLRVDSVGKNGWVHRYRLQHRDTVLFLPGDALRRLLQVADTTRYDRPLENEQYFAALEAFFEGHEPSIFPRGAWVRKDYLAEHGSLPYSLYIQYRLLVKAFSQKNGRNILKYAADLGHYIGDAHVPLHTTSNYNGQKTGQHGIHGFWESRIPELFAEKNYDFFVGKATYLPDMKQSIWDMVLESHQAVDSVLMFEKNLRNTYPSDQQMCPEQRGRTLMQMPCPDYAAAYSDSMDGMVERRMRAAVLALGSVWYSAWVDAGQPNLNDLADYAPSAADLEEERIWKEKYEAGKIIGRPEH